MGRPRKKIDIETFKKLCALQCTLREIAGFFDVSEDTIENWCKREFKEGFSDVFKTYSANGLISLRRHQFRLAEKSAAMAIFLGKNYLGQVDAQRIETKNDGSLADLIEGLKEPEVVLDVPGETESTAMIPAVVDAISKDEENTNGQRVE